MPQPHPLHFKQMIEPVRRAEAGFGRVGKVLLGAATYACLGPDLSAALNGNVP